MDLPLPVSERLARLAPDQRAAATSPPGPVLCIAPAGSGKTTTLVARIAWLVARGVPPAEITAITFNRRAAVELAERLENALAPIGARVDGPAGDGTPRLDSAPTGGTGGVVTGPTRTGQSVEPGVRVRTFHALGLEILRSTSRPLGRLVPREEVLRRVAPWADRSALGRLDTAISRLKLELNVDPAEVARDPAAGPVARTYVAYESWLAGEGAIDFDDLVRLALRALREDATLLARWRRACAHLLVDEAQDVDRSQLALALLLAAPENRIFLVGDDDQSIYGWRLADVRRILELAAALPGLRRTDLQVNYRCPSVVVRRAVRLVEHNRERFAKAIRAGPVGIGSLILGPDGSDDDDRARRLLAGWLDDGATRAILARTNRELLPAAVVALEIGRPFRAAGLRLVVESAHVDAVLDEVRRSTDGRLPLLARIEAVRRRLANPTTGALEACSVIAAHGQPSLGPEGPDEPDPVSVASAMLAWAVPYPDLDTFAASVARTRARVAELRRDDAALTLATAHATKGLEFDHVAILGMDAGRFPSARAIADAADPDRAMEEERRLAYVAWTRARRSLTLVYDPAAPSPFMREAFDAAELGVDQGADTTPPGIAATGLRHDPGRAPRATPAGGSTMAT